MLQTTSNSTLLLTYDLTTAPFPLQASAASQGGEPVTASLVLLAQNNSGSDVQLQGIAIQLPVGTSANDLTEDATSIVPVSPAGWDPPAVNPAQGSMSYVFTPANEDSITLKQGDSLTFVFNGITVNTVSGIMQIMITEYNSICNGANCPVKEIDLTKFPNGWGEVTFSSPDPNIAPGDPAFLNWSGPAGATYTIEYYTQETGLVNVPAPNENALANQGQYPDAGTNFILQRNTTFTLNVSEMVNDVSYNAQIQVQVTVDTPPVLGITSFGSSAQAFGAGETFTLTWVVTDAASCQISIDGGSGAVPVPCISDVTNSCNIISKDGRTLQFTDAKGNPLGSLTLPNPNAANIMLRLTAVNGSDVQSAILVNLLPPIINSFTKGYNLRIPMGETIKWSVSNAASVTLNGVEVQSNSEIGRKLGGTFTLVASGFGEPVSNSNPTIVYTP